MKEMPIKALVRNWRVDLLFGSRGDLEQNHENSRNFGDLITLKL
jgi:hypothetical protein